MPIVAGRFCRCVRGTWLVAGNTKVYGPGVSCLISRCAQLLTLA